MAVKIRLQRHGKKGKPFYWIVAADARVKRDGKILEKLGTYNPNTNPATIDINVDNSITWLENGAQPTHTARAILSYKGVLFKKHLAGGVKKGAFSEEEAEKRFKAWLAEKEEKIKAKAKNIEEAAAKAKADALKAEKEINEARKAAAAPQAEVVKDAPKATEEVSEEQKKQTIDEAAAEAASEGANEKQEEDSKKEE
ncbi:MAG: 30S ribosomal protein S16 [Flavobacteriales bacterium]|nr:MAG: 30S ribosomal protein S16 [Flavobacteriales bacterium]